MRILVVGLNYAPEPVGIGPYTAGLAEALAQRGHRVAAIVGKPYYPQWRSNLAFSGGWRRGAENGVALTRCPHYIPANPTGLRRILHLASFALSALGPALRAALRRREDRPELVIAVAPALLSVVPAWLAAKLAGARLWVHLQDFEVEAAVATGLLRERGWPARLALWFEGRILKLADKVSTISPQMCARLIAKGVAAERVIEIRNWSDSRFRAEAGEVAALRARWGLEGASVCLYSGNIARKQGIEVLVDAARLLAGRRDIAVVICGEGPNRAALAALAEGFANVQLHDLQPAENMGAMLAMASVHLLPQIAGAADLVLPSKLTYLLASGRPVIATTEPGTGLAVEIEDCGLVTPPGDAAALAAAIVALVDDQDRCAGLGEAARQRAAERWEKSAIVRRFEQAALELVALSQG